MHKKDAKRNKIYFVKKIQSHFQIGVDCFQSFFQCYAIDKNGLGEYCGKHVSLRFINCEIFFNIFRYKVYIKMQKVTLMLVT